MTDNKLCPIRAAQGNKLPWCWRDKCEFWKVSHIIDVDGVQTKERCAINAITEVWFLEDDSEILDE